MRTLNPCNLIGPIGTVLIGQNRATLVGRRCKALIEWASVLLVEIRFQENFIRAGSDSRNTVQAGSSVQVSP